MKMNKKWLVAVGLVAIIPIVTLCGCGFRPGSPGLDSLPASLRVSMDSQQQGIWVTGQGKTTAVPDVASLSVGVEAQEATVAEAQAEASAAMDRVMTALTSGGVAEKDIKTQYFNIRQRTRWDDETDKEIVTGYRVTNTVTAKIRDIDKVGSIIDAVAVAGGDLIRIDSISFSIDDPSVYYKEVREKAMADANAKAEQLASLGGVKLGKPLYISEGISSSIPKGVRMEMAGGAPVPAPAPSPPPISAGEMEISLTVQVTYAILN